MQYMNKTNTYMGLFTNNLLVKYEKTPCKLINSMDLTHLSKFNLVNFVDLGTGKSG